MAEVLLSSDDLTVLGGPAEISLDVDFGPQGERGSLIFYGSQKPDAFSFPTDLKVYDIYINVNPTDDEYQFVYQYLPEVGGALNWAKVLRLSPTIYSYNQTVAFDSSGTSLDPIEILLSNFVSEDLIGTYSSDDFNVQVNILNENPVSIGTTVLDITPGSIQALPISIKAIEYSSGSWQPLTGSQTVHILVTLKNNIS
jgi:hypothetical protein